MLVSKKLPRPFVKWAGGKGQMAAHIVPRLPESIGTYCEPFVGGGAVFFELFRQRRFKKAILGDTNPELMITYSVIQDDVNKLIERLQAPDYRYDKTLYLKARAMDPSTMSLVDRAARFLFLNRTCFNGLYRVNGGGGFNVPFGRFTNPVICDQENLRAVSASLEGVKLVHGGFKWVLEEGLGEGDAIYFDPPYLPVSRTSSFTAYTKEGFGKTEHMRLAAAFFDLASADVSVVLSNSSTPYAKRLYSEGCELKDVVGSRNISGGGEHRKAAGEIVVWAGPTPRRGRVRR